MRCRHSKRHLPPLHSHRIRKPDQSSPHPTWMPEFLTLPALPHQNLYIASHSGKHFRQKNILHKSLHSLLHYRKNTLAFHIYIFPCQSKSCLQQSIPPKSSAVLQSLHHSAFFHYINRHVYRYSRPLHRKNHPL